MTLLTFEVRRVRTSVTQGEAQVWCNGKFLINFADKIEIVQPGGVYYGDNVGGYASTTPDSDFLMGALYHGMDDVYHYSDRVKAVIKSL